MYLTIYYYGCPANSGTRSNKPFIAINCGAIPSELIDSTLFGHKKGSFTGAVSDQKGVFEAATGGTLFLDEVGELPLQAQVRLLRAIQEKEIVRVGDTKPQKVDCRIITATNRLLVEEIPLGNFREDLYYRIAVFVLWLPPLREREGDLGLLIGKLLDQVNIESELEPGLQNKKISVNAKNLMLQHRWPGNVRELLNTIRSAAIWSDGDRIEKEDVEDALLSGPVRTQEKEQLLIKDISQGVELTEIILSVARHYIELALAETNNNKTRAAELLGLKNYQTLSNWIEKYDIN